MLWLIHLGGVVGGVPSDGTFAQDCEMCGLLFWRMETGLSAKKNELSDYKEDLEKRAANSPKGGQGKHWIRAEYPVQLVDAMESYVEKACENDVMLASTVCKKDGILESVLRSPGDAGWYRF